MKKPDRQPSRSLAWPLFVAVLVAVLAGLAWRQLQRAPASLHLQRRDTLLIEPRLPIPRCAWDPHAVNASEFHKSHDTPCIVDGHQWRALRRWNIPYLSSVVSEWNGVYRNVPGKRVFGPYYDEKRPLALLKAVRKPDDYHSILNGVSGAELERWLLAEPSPDVSLHYFTGNIAQILEHAQYNLLDDVRGFETFEVAPQSRQQNINVWLGGAGPVTHLHYDSYVNWNVQISGRKVWTLFPPSAESIVRPYSFLHPSHAQSSVAHLKDVAASQIPMQGVLVAGETLYVPPMWWHHVQAVEPSVSINFWSMTVQSDVVARIFALLDGIVESAKLSGRTSHNVAFAHALISRVLDETILYFDADDSDEAAASALFVARLHAARHAHMVMDAAYDKADVAIRSFCSTPGNVVNAVRQFGFDKQCSSSADVASIVKLLLQLPSDSRDVWTGHVVEYAAAIALSPQSVGALLRWCFG